MTNSTETPDAKIPGLYIRTWPSGKRSAAIRYVVAGQQRRLSLGVLGQAFTIDQARKAAKTQLAKVTQGRDPSREKKAERDAETFADVAKRWLEEHAAPTCKPRTAQRYRELVTLHLVPLLGTEKIGTITRAHVERAHRKIGEKPGRGGPAKGAANRALLVASAIFNWCEGRGIRPQGSNPCRGIKRFAEKGAGHFYSGAELARIDAVLATAEASTAGAVDYFSPGVVAALRICMVTGCRLSDAVNLRWSEVDLDRAQLVLADTKSGRSIRPMMPAAVELLRALKRARDSTSDYVCPTSSGRPIGASNIDRAWRSIRERAELPPAARVHDLRHTAGSLALDAGMPLPLVSKMLGHKSVATTAKIYAHALAESQDAAMVRFGAAFTATLERGRTENAEERVVPMRKAKAVRR